MELFDSPMVFFAQTDKQKIADNTRANFSARSVLPLRTCCTKSLRALIFKGRSVMRTHENRHARGCAAR
jgi:hypothetical protein